MLVHVSVWASISRSGIELPWSGTAYVNCDGTKKVNSGVNVFYWELKHSYSACINTADKVLRLRDVSARSSKKEREITELFILDLKCHTIFHITRTPLKR